MRKAIKNKGRIVQAYELGAGSQMERALIRQGRIRVLEDGRYELFSLESVNGSGEIASKGDYFKVDEHGFPYPNSRAFFLVHHRHIEGDTYDQIPRALEAWTIEDGMCPEIEYLIAHEGLVIDGANPEKYFSAPLYGTLESAARDAVIVFYEISRDESGAILDVSFNFVERGIFERTYEWVKS